ncbi:uncharacterized protein [Leuresthes tenuis]|uniref:uncharacterized protein n=1 Tax=Leuresthes tenuis TaxID=355514 RepID=UPI003B505B13
MSRRSLRLDDGLLDRNLPHSSASFSVGGVSWRSNRSLKSRQSQRHSASCSESLLLLTPRNAAGPSILDSSLHSVASDASLISSLLDDSSIQENTLVGSFWGLDQDVDPKGEFLLLLVVFNDFLTSSWTHSLCLQHQQLDSLLVSVAPAAGLTPCVCSTSSWTHSLCLQHQQLDSLLVSAAPAAGLTPCQLDSLLVSAAAGLTPCVCSTSSWTHSLCLQHQQLDSLLHQQLDSLLVSAAAGLTPCVCSGWTHSLCLQQLDSLLVSAAAGLTPCVCSGWTHSLCLQRLDSLLVTSGWTHSLCLQRLDSLLVSAAAGLTPCQLDSLLVSVSESTGVAEDCSVVENPPTASGCAKHPALSRVYCNDCSRSAAQAELSSAEPDTSIVYCRERARRTARPGRCGVMSPMAPNPKELPNGSLCDDCKEKQLSKTGPGAASCSSVAARLLELTCSAAVFTGSITWLLSQRAAAALRPLIRTVFSASLRAGRSAGQTGFRWLCRRWRHMTAGPHLTGFPVRLLAGLLPLLLLFSLCWFGPASFQSVLRGVNVTAWMAAVPDAPALSSVLSPSQSRSAEEEPMAAALQSPAAEPQEVPAGESDRLVRVEQSLMALWERVEARGRRVEQRYKAVRRLHADLHQQQLLASQSGAKPWISGLMQLTRLRRRLEEDRRRAEEVRNRDLWQRSRQTTRLDQLELQLQTLAARTQVQAEGDAAAGSETLPAAVSDGEDRRSHDALLEEVSRLETALGDVRRDVESLSSCQDWCRQLDGVQQTISDQVREEVRALIYGNQLTAGGDAAAAAAPESLLQWLSLQFVSPADLQVALASLELSILQNISLQLERRRSDETEGGATSAGTAMTREDIRAMVTDALRRFSEDRTGLADYALESGGGSILSTRCSETYETKAALLSLFGVPLWYFSQSPRAVIQPDVHPGNCWAFRGSTGFLVIRLSMMILPTVFTLEHIPKALAPSGTLRSAPRDFSVYGLDDESQERGKLLGAYTYDQDGEALQMFPASEENDGFFQIIEVQVLSNWGHPEYTCMYRFRVHGTPGGERPEE